MTRVLLTRPADESAAIAGRLTPLRWRPVVAPLIAIEPLPVALPAGPFDAVLVTSAHATSALPAGTREPLRFKPLLAVGDGSAAAAREAGFVDVRIAGGDAAALRDLVRLTLPAPSRLLYLAGRVRKPALAARLAGDGHDVVVLETYDAVAVPWTEATIASLRANPPRVCLHFSRRSAALAVAEIERSGLGALLVRSLQLCLSPDVAVPLQNAGAAQVRIAVSPTAASLLQALCGMLDASTTLAD